MTRLAQGKTDILWVDRETRISLRDELEQLYNRLEIAIESANFSPIGINCEANFVWANLKCFSGTVSLFVDEALSYCLSKLALNGLTIMLTQALRADGISSIRCAPVGSERIWVARMRLDLLKKVLTPRFG